MIRHGRLIMLIAIASLSAGCAKEEKKKTGWGNFPVAIYADATILNSPGASADLQDAMNFWEAHAGKRLFDFRGAWSGGQPFEGDPTNPSALFGNVIAFLNPWPYAQSYAAQTVVRTGSSGIQGSVILMNPMMHFCTGGCERDAFSTSSKVVFTHELGHFLGLTHVDDRNNIMYPQAISAAALPNISVDEASLRSLTN